AREEKFRKSGTVVCLDERFLLLEQICRCSKFARIGAVERFAALLERCREILSHIVEHRNPIFVARLPHNRPAIWSAFDLVFAIAYPGCSPRVRDRIGVLWIKG